MSYDFNCSEWFANGFLMYNKMTIVLKKSIDKKYFSDYNQREISRCKINHNLF